MGVGQSFAKAQRTLAEVAGWQLDDNTIRQLCHATAAAASASREERTDAETFARASGDPEVQIDAGKVNTQEGWRDVKVGVFALRERGEGCSPQEWDERDLPAPKIRSVIASVEEASLFGERCADEAKRLGFVSAAEVSVLGDGAEWIWNLAERHFAGSREVLDIWHACEYVRDAAKAVLGQEDTSLQEESAKGKLCLLRDGYWGVTEWLGELSPQIPERSDGTELARVFNYLCGHQERLNYALRLYRGQSIGSGLVEGSIKQLLNNRLKQTGARWKVEHVGPLVELAAMANGPEWDRYWQAA